MNRKIDYDVIIIGSGPAGLFAAHELSNKFNGRVLLVDKGNSFENRTCSSLSKKCTDHKVCSMTSGMGGAGLFSDGKLCLSESAGGSLKSLGYSKSESSNLLAHVVDVFRRNGIEIPIQVGTTTKNDELRKRFKKEKLALETYPVHRLSFDERKLFIKSLIETATKQNVTIMPNTEALGIRDYATEKEMTLKRGVKIKRYRCKYLILAPGKVGVEWINRQIRELNLSAKNNPLYLGVRLELSKEVTAVLSEISENPRISYNSEIGDYIKTHCFSDKGQVVITDYMGLKTVDGTYLEQNKTDKTSINLLMRWDLPGYVQPFDFIANFIRYVNWLGKFRPIVQTLSDAKRFRISKPEVLRDNKILPTLNDCVSQDLTSLLSFRYSKNFFSLIERIDNFVPGFNDDNNLIYAPAVEWWCKRINVNRSMETSRKNIFAIGDGAGLSQGIVMSAMTGIQAARSIIQRI